MNIKIINFNNEISILKSIIIDQDKKLKDLEAKLAEKEAENKILIKGEYARCCKTCCAFDEQEAIARDYYNECESLKKQLAEKEKRILELQEDSIRDNQIYNEQLTEKDKEKKI